MSKAFDQAYRDRLRREQEFFTDLAAEGHELSWAETQPAAHERKLARAARLLEAAGLQTATRAQRVLEVGCGSGDYTEQFVAGTSAAWFGLDATHSVFEHARRAAPSGVDFSAGDACALPFRDGAFDVVIGNAVLHHLDLDHAFPELLRVLAPGGRLCFAEPNMANPHLMLVLGWPWLRKRMHASPDEVAFYRRPLTRALEHAGFRDVAVTPFDFLYPMTPRPLIGLVQSIAPKLERTPGIREIAGSLLIVARKPSPDDSPS